MAVDPRHLPARCARLFRCTLLLACVLGAGLAPGAARAQIGSYRYSSIIVDDSSGRVAEAVNADAGRFPASLTKLMTLYMTFEAIRDHRIALNQLVPISARAAGMEPVKLGLLPGSRLTVEDAILAIVTKSANDAACALGELIGGTEDRFAQTMTLRAKALGMTRSTFRNASGLPDPQQVSTARDLALLAHHLITEFPSEYHYFSVPDFVFHGRDIPNHDRMLTDYDGADGLKTGYTRAAGHNLVTSARRGGVRLIGVVMGADSNTERDAHMASLLDNGFEQMGVPIAPHPARRFSVPLLMASADAAPLRARFASLRGHHGRLVRLVLRRGGAMPRVTLAAVHGMCRAHHHCGVHARKT